MNRYGDSGLFDPIHGDGYAEDAEEATLTGEEDIEVAPQLDGATAPGNDSPRNESPKGSSSAASADVGPPPPGADGDYPDPEIGLEC